MNGINITYNITGGVLEDYSAGGGGDDAPSVFDPCAAENDTGKDYADFYRTAQFVTGLICYPIICLVGLTGKPGLFSRRRYRYCFRNVCVSVCVCVCLLRL